MNVNLNIRRGTTIVSIQLKILKSSKYVYFLLIISNFNKLLYKKILNFRVVLKPVKNWFIPLPNFEAEDFPKTISFAEEEQNYEKEEYVFHWQEKVFNKSEFVKFKDSDKKGELDVKYCHSNLQGDFSRKKLPEKLFSFVDVDNFSIDENVFSMPFNTKKTLKIDFKNSSKKLEKIPKSKIISYPNFKNKLNSTKSCSQKMFIMIDLNSNNGYVLIMGYKYHICLY